MTRVDAIGTQVSTSRPGAPTVGIEPRFEGDFLVERDLLLEGGGRLVGARLHYAVYGELNAAGDNAVFVGHALSGSARVGDWWPGLFGTSELAGNEFLVGELAGLRDGQLRSAGDEAGKGQSSGIVNLSVDCVVCVNLLGSCYGSTGPGSVDPGTGEAYGPDFPVVSIRDNVRAQALLMDALGIAKFKLAIGGSIGGMQALEWAILFSDRVVRAVIVGVAPLGAMGLALNHLQRTAIMGDPAWAGGRYVEGEQPRRGLAMARAMAMLSYKSAALFEERFGRKPNRTGEDPWAGGRFDVAGFLDYQGEQFLERFDANSYLAILRTMDLWDPAGEFERIEAELVLVGISSDWLFPAADVRRLAERVGAEYREMVTDHGHDAFLAEQGEFVRVVRGN